jgi:hypothetical protein
MIDLDPVFNDLSCKPLAADKYEASKRMEDFVGVLNEFPTRGMGSSLRTTGEFYGLEISEGYTISDWMFDPQSPQVERQLLSTLATKSPILVGLDTTVSNEAERSEASCAAQVSEALLVSYLINLPLISLNHALWEDPFIDCLITEMDDEGEIKESYRSLINYSELEHFEKHEHWIETRRKTNLQSLAEVWDARQQQFPHLYFAKEVEAQLVKIPSGSNIAAQVLDRLFDLERVAGIGEAFSNLIFRTTCSASSTTALGKFESAYSFKDDSGNSHLCGWHLKMQNGNRIYFADLGGRYLIGHIGEHLPTKRDN